ncbi:MAG: DNA methyltransferase [Hyphomicrobiaceae bacterium]|nr:DNA methyltransferase [Hyphomicrobiaceae bacterium]
MRKYKIIYADPPWDYGSFPSMDKVTHAYPLMRTEDICALPVASIAHPDALLFLWATMCKLPEAFRVIEAWGFRYVSNGFTWVKTHPSTGNFCVGMGYWTRQNAELCLVAKRGRPSRRDKNVSSVIVSPRGVHSAKPAIVRDHILRVAGDLPRIELFARNKTPGWDIWGNELPNDIDLANAGDDHVNEVV